MRDFSVFAGILAIRGVLVSSSLILDTPLLFSGGNRTNTHTTQCGLFLVPSTIPGHGRGVVAGIDFDNGANIESVPTLSVTCHTMDATQLKNYGFGSTHEDYATIILGPGGIYNHRKPHTLLRYWADDDGPSDPTDLPFPYSDLTRILYRTRTAIKAGEEIHETYGDNWFDRFQHGHSNEVVEEAEQVAKVMSVKDMQEHGHCLTDVDVRESTIPRAGNGLFAVKSFNTGDVVDISPVLAMSRHVVDASVDSSVLKNYCFAVEDSDLVLFPFSYGALINHNSTGEANVKVEWYDWSPAVEALAAKYPSDTPVLNANRNLNLRDKLKMSVKELFNAPFAQLDIAYVATRPIAPGEEIVLDYGAAWHAAWETFTHRKAEWESSTKLGATGEPAPTFRQYLGVPNGLYQEHWKRREQEPTGCGLFLIPSTIPGAGRGVVAGRQFHPLETVETVPMITVTQHASTHSQLTNYVFGTGHDDFNAVIVGPGNIYNHRKPNTLGRFGTTEEEPDPTFARHPYTSYTDVKYTALEMIEVGEEMYETYGDSWFERFAHKAQADDKVVESPREAVHMEVADLLQHGHCLTDTAVRASAIPNAGNGLFAARDFAAGEIVAISPVLSLPKKVVDSTYKTTVLINYCFADPDSELVLFPINYAPMINHNHTEANVKVEWFDWSPAVEALAAKYHPDLSSSVKNQNLRLSDKLKMSAKELYTAPFAQLDIAYRATRPIAKGEEVLVDYGPAWEAAWLAYTAKHQLWAQSKLSSPSEPLKEPMFRRYMALPDGMYSPGWLNLKTTSAHEL